ncbi:MAG: hypothetical protein AAB676_03410 [Verrucomicrobiota bacterium]
MNGTHATPNLNPPAAPELPVRALRSPYFILQTPIGGYYLDEAYNQQLVKRPNEGLSRFLAKAQRVLTSGGGLGEVQYGKQEGQRPLRYLHEGALREFEEVASSFYKGGITSDQANLRQNLKLPDPREERDAYWVWGERFAPQLMVLWGCEKRKGSSLPLVGDGDTVVAVLKRWAMSWLRLFREGIELSRIKDSLGAYLAFPVLDANGKLTHIERLINGQYVRKEIQKWWYEFWKVRPLKALPARHVAEFQKAAEEFYRQAHPQPAVPGTPSHAAGLSYEQELRRGFRLPDPDKRPDAYFVYGKPFAGRLLILCPHPGVKDQEEIAQAAKELELLEDKALKPQLQKQYEQDSAVYNLYKRFFYSENECLCLTNDEKLGLPVPIKSPATGLGQLPAPTTPVRATPADVSHPTVVAKHWKRRINWARIIMLWATIFVGLAAAGLVVHALWPKRLAALSAEVLGIVGPRNEKNVVVVTFGNRINPKSLLLATREGKLTATFSLQAGGSPITVVASPDPQNSRRIILQANAQLVDIETNTVSAAGVLDIWGNTLAPTNLIVKYTDTNAPNAVSVMVTSLDSLVLTFDERLNTSIAQQAANYVVNGAAALSATLPVGLTSVVVQAPMNLFPSNTLSFQVADLSRQTNWLRVTNQAVIVTNAPPKISRVTANQDRRTVLIETDVGVHPEFAKGLTNYAILTNLTVLNAVATSPSTVVLTLAPPGMVTNVDYAAIVTLANVFGRTAQYSQKFRFDPVDKTAPAITNVTISADRLRLNLMFNKPPVGTAIQQTNMYRLYARQEASGPWLPLSLVVRAGLSIEPKLIVVDLASPHPPAPGGWKVEVSGVEDGSGNRADCAYQYPFTGICPAPSLASNRIEPPQMLRLLFSSTKPDARLDPGCIVPENFKLLRNGIPCPITSIASTNITGGTIVYLGLREPAVVGSTSITGTWSNLRLVGQVLMANGVIDVKY